MTDLPKISIITVCYNSEKTIESTIQSVRNQHYPNKEFILVDGASTDRTLEIIDRYTDDIDTFISEKDSGIPDALNKGIRAATGDWLYFLSGDDVFFDDYVLENIFQEPREADMIYGNVLMKSSSVMYDGEFNLLKLLTRNICHQAQFFKKELFEKIGVYNTRYKLLSDYDYTLRIYANTQLATSYINWTVAVFNDRGRTSISMDQDFLNDRKIIFFDRFRHIISAREIVRSYEPLLYYSFKKGSILKGLIILIEMLYWSRNRKYINAAVKNLMMRFGTHH